MSQNVIRDGQARPFYVAAIEGLYEAMEGEFRPLLPEQIDEVQAAVRTNQDKNPTAASHTISKAVTKHLVSWSEIDDDKKPVPIGFDAVRKLPFLLMHKVYRIICLLDVSDLRPDATAKESNGYMDSLNELGPVKADEAATKN